MTKQKKSSKTDNKFKLEKNEETWEGEQVTVESDTKLEDDHGTGHEVIIRTFEFKANPEAFRYHTPTEQELFNSHARGMKGQIWADGLSPAEDIEPRIIFSKNKDSYRIFISCRPSIGNTILEKTQTLSEIANEPSRN